jgi:hypothetical protein
MNPQIIFILDRSGSMNAIAEETVTGFNRFVADQKSIVPDATLTLILLNECRRVVCEREPIIRVAQLTRETFNPTGGTALLDAIGEMIVQESDGPAQRVIVAILTDGLENSSCKFSRDQVFELIREQQENGWKFLFLGADQDAIQEGCGLGIAAANSLGFASTGDRRIPSGPSQLQRPPLSWGDSQPRECRQV